MKTTTIYRSILLLPFLSIGLSFSLNAQTWSKLYGDERSQYAHDIIAVSQDTFLMVGTENRTINFGDYRIVLYRLNGLGDTIWTKTYPSTDREYPYKILRLRDGNFLIGGSSDEGDWNSRSMLMKINPQGDLMWKKLYSKNGVFVVVENPDSSIMIGGADGFYKKLDTEGNVVFGRLLENDAADSQIQQIIPAPDGSYFLVGRINLGVTFSGIFVTKISADGQEIWYRRKNLDYSPGTYGNSLRPLGAVLTNEQTLLLAATYTTFYNTSLIEYDSDGKLLRFQDYGGRASRDFVFDMEKDMDGNIWICGQADYFPEGRQAFIRKLSPEGYEYFNYRYGRKYPAEDAAIAMALLPEGGLVYCGTSTDSINVNENLAVTRLNELGHFYHRKLQIEVFEDSNQNCELDRGDVPFVHQKIKVTGTMDKLLSTNKKGKAEAMISTGFYTVSLIRDDVFWTSCNDQYTLWVYSDYNDTLRFLIQPTDFNDCPRLSVDLTAPELVPCSASNYFLTYCNKGFKTATNAHIKVELDENLTLLEASSTYILDNNNLVFYLDSISARTDETIKLKVQLGCDVNLGKAHLVKAQTFTDEWCPEETPTEWSGASLETSIICEGELIRLRVSNLGLGAIDEALKYRIFQDGYLKQSGVLDFLNPLENQEWGFEGMGSTWHIEAEQASFHPGLKQPSATIQSCGKLANPFPPIGLYSYFKHADTAPDISITSVQNYRKKSTGKMTNLPRGYGFYKMSEPNQGQDYNLKIQNTTQETANHARVKLIFHPWYDLTSFQPKAASHSFTYQILDNVTIELFFENVQLPAASENELASSLFFRFYVAQTPDIPDQTYMTIDAAAYFDYKGPYRAQNAYQNIWYDFIEDSPQPFSDGDTILQLGGPLYEFASDIAVNPFDEVFIVGTTTSFHPIFNYDAYVAKLKPNGEGLWFQIFDELDGSENFNAVLPLKDGGCIAVGSNRPISDEGTFILVVRYDANGDLIWKKSNIQINGSTNIANSIIKMENGNFLIGGYKIYDYVRQRGLIMGITKEGNILYKGRIPKIDDVGEMGKLKRTKDGKYFAVSNHYIGSPYYYQTVVRRFKEDGQQSWFKTYLTSYVHEAVSSTATKDSNLIILANQLGLPNATHPPSPYLYKINWDGDIIWEKTYPELDSLGGMAIAPSSNSGYYIIGHYHYLSTLADKTFIMKVDEDGELLWFKNIDAHSREEAIAIARNLDNQVLGLVQSRPLDWLRNLQMLLIKFEDTHVDSEIEERPTYDFKIFPNPTTSEATLELPILNIPLDVKLTNLMGRSMDIATLPSAQQISIDLSTYPSGIYFVQIWSKGRILATKKIVKIETGAGWK